MQRWIEGTRKACLHSDAGRRSSSPNKKAHPFSGWAFSLGRLAVTYFRAGNPHYHRRRVVSPSCSGWEGVGPTRYGRQANCWVRRHPSTPLPHWAYGFNNPEEVRLGLDRQQQALSPLSSGIRVQGVAVTPHPSRLTPHTTQGYRIKSHGQLVSVSLTHCCASTPDLSTRWSTATL